MCAALTAAALAGCGSSDSGDEGKGSQTVDDKTAGDATGDSAQDEKDAADDGAQDGKDASGEGGVTDEHHYEGIELTEDDVELTVWESTAGADEFVIKAGEKFTEMYPNIKIKYVNVELGDTKSQIALDGPGGVGPDLFATPNNTLGMLTDGGHILEAPNPEYIKEKSIESCATAVTYKDTVWGYPISADT